MGRIVLSFAPRNEYGVLDHQVTLASGETFYNPIRVTAVGAGCEVVFSLRRPAGVSDQDFERDAEAVFRTVPGGHTPSHTCGGHPAMVVVEAARSRVMPLVNIRVIEGVFPAEQKREMIRRITDTMVEIEGENLRPVTWVLVEEVRSGDWGIGGDGLTTGDVKSLQQAASPVGS
jgi:4-oxalocrotonate tautomerase